MLPKLRTITALRLLGHHQTTKSFTSSNPSNYRKQITIASILQRHGFPSSSLHKFLTHNNNFLLNQDPNNLSVSLNILLTSFKLPQHSLITLITQCPNVLDLRFLQTWQKGMSCFDGFTPKMVMSVLGCSKRFGTGPERVSRVFDVLMGFGVKDGTIRKVLEEFPEVMVIEGEEVGCRIEFLLGLGIGREGLDWVVYSVPQVLGFSVEGRLRSLVEEFLELGFGEGEIRREVLREPRVIGMEVGELTRCLELLRGLKCREAIKERVSREGSFRAGFEVKLRVDLLCRHGLIRREAFKVLWKEPRLITYELGNIEKKIEFLVHTMNCDVECLVDVPEYLGVNFEKQIVPRYNVIEYLRSKGALAFDVGLRDLIKPSRLRFYNLYVKPYPECEKMFGRFSGDVEVKKQKHPVGMWKLFKPQKHQESEEDVKNVKAFMETVV